MRFVAWILSICLCGSLHAQLRESVLASMPPVGPELSRPLHDPWTLWFDESIIPRAMQFGANSDPATVHDGYHRFNQIDVTTNPNLEYPWRAGGGLHAVDPADVQVAKFYFHPDRKPIVYFRTTRSSVYHQQLAWDWVFPVDSVVGEVLAVRRGGFTYPFEVRLLTREEDAWHPQVFRQFNSPEELAGRLEDLGADAWAGRIRSLEYRTGKLLDTFHAKPTVTLEYRHAVLPDLPENLVDRLLQEPLKERFESSTLGSEKTQLLPKGYFGSAVGSGRDDCMACHNHVAKHANEFDRPGRDWYGYVRGSDRIFSFHPFALSAISGNGGDLPVAFNQSLLEAGYIAPWSNQTGYRRIQ